MCHRRLHDSIDLLRPVALSMARISAGLVSSAEARSPTSTAAQEGILDDLPCIGDALQPVAPAVHPVEAPIERKPFDSSCDRLAFCIQEKYAGQYHLTNDSPALHNKMQKKIL